MSGVTEQSYVLLNSGQAFFPVLLQAIEKAQSSVALETYIFDFNGVGARVAQALCDAADRGIQVRVLADGLGTPSLPAIWRNSFARSGVAFMLYRPVGTLGLLFPRRWRRLHRKLCVIDQEVAFCGGINILDDRHDPNHGALSAPRLDFALQIQGPMVQAIAFESDALWRTSGGPLPPDARRVDEDPISALARGKRALSQTKATLRRWAHPLQGRKTRLSNETGHAQTGQLLLRDNLRYRRSIERAYLSAIAGAKNDITLANAYFLPGKPLRLALVRAAQRGVKVRVLLQGRYEYFMQYYAARAVYLNLLNAGVEIFEYEPSFLHAKVAVVDAHGAQPWATVGSSNLDPLSLLLAREANVVVTGLGVPQQLHDQLQQAIDHASRQVYRAELNQASRGRKLLNWVAYTLMRTALFLTGNRY